MRCCVPLLAGMLAIVSSACSRLESNVAGDLLATIDLDHPDASGEAQLPLPPGTHLNFPVRVGATKAARRTTLNATVQLLRDGAVVGEVTCAGYQAQRGDGSGGWQLLDGCRAVVPDGGATSVRASTHAETASATFAGIGVEVRRSK
jgi:hypothetical protein